MPNVFFSADIDTLESIYKGYGKSSSDEYSGIEFPRGLANLNQFFESYDAGCTLFLVGKDLECVENRNLIKNLSDSGHELANHSYSHFQNFRFLTSDRIREEVSKVTKLIQEATGKSPVGFRAPGWNISDKALPILMEQNYLYDSSIFPTSLSCLLKLSYRMSNGNRQGANTTLGQWNYTFAPIQPYQTKAERFSEQGNDGIIEFPIAVSPILRLPITATFLFYFGQKRTLNMIQSILLRGYDLQFQFHLSDFVDYSSKDLSPMIPNRSTGAYVPKALSLDYGEKLKIFRYVMDSILKDFTPLLMSDKAKSLLKKSDTTI